MIDLKKIRKDANPKILVFGNHPGIIQSILDFDFLAGKNKPSVIGIVGAQQRLIRYFWGSTEILIPGFAALDEIDQTTVKNAALFVVAQSGRRAVTASEEALIGLPNVLGGMIFAEGVPERHALQLRKITDDMGKFVLGPASVGMAISGAYKLGAIGGTLPEQIVISGILTPGNVAVISSSGGMINELMTMVTAKGSGISFAAAVGGERYPLTTPTELVLQALEDKATEAIVYFGELGGIDEYEVCEVLKKHKNKKPFITYIAGTIAEKFESAPQFGHAKSLAQNKSETATAKRKILKESGATVARTFADFEAQLRKLPKHHVDTKQVTLFNERLKLMHRRTPAMFLNSVSSDQGGEVKILGTPLIDFVSSRSLSHIALSMFLGKEPKSRELSEFFDVCIKLLVDHGPQVSGAVNTMITARAGKDLTAALATGILTIGPRFGGALSEAATGWFEAVNVHEPPDMYVERYAQSKRYIAGIGHKKYRLDNPDPRVKLLLEKFDTKGRYITFAKAVAGFTTRKKAQLILNVDGTIAALLLDILADKEGYSEAQIRTLLATDFCNAIFVYARSVGFIAHYLEQRRLDEGLFRLPDTHISSFN